MRELGQDSLGNMASGNTVNRLTGKRSLSMSPLVAQQSNVCSNLLSRKVYRTANEVVRIELECWWGHKAGLSVCANRVCGGLVGYRKRAWKIEMDD